MKATELLKKDHAAVKKLFQSFENAGEREKRKQEIFQQIRESLDRHAQIEEEIFYPAVREATEARADQEGTDLVLEAQQEHHVMKTLLTELDGMAASDEDFDAKVKVLQENVQHHIEEEEGQMFPRADRELGGERLEELGREMAARDGTLKKPTSTRIVDSVKTLIFGGDAEQESRSAGSSARGRSSASRGGRGRQGRGESGRKQASARSRKQGGSSRAKGAQGAAGRSGSSKSSARSQASSGRGRRAKASQTRAGKSQAGGSRARQSPSGARGRGGRKQSASQARVTAARRQRGSASASRGRSTAATARSTSKARAARAGGRASSSRGRKSAGRTKRARGR